MRVAFLTFDLGEYSIRLATAVARELAASSARRQPGSELLLIMPEELVAINRSLFAPERDALTLRTFAKPRLRQVPQQISLMARIHRWIRAFDPDLIHFQSRHIWFNLSMPLLNRYPFVVTIHDPREHQGEDAAWKVPQFISDFGYRRADQVIVHGRRMKEMTVNEIRIPEDCVNVVPMIALGKEPSIPYPEDETTILFFGRIWGYKGLDVLIHAQPRISAQIPDARIVIAGQGEDFSRYRRMMIHPEAFVVHNSYIPDELQGRLFQEASVIVLPYIEATQSGVVPVAYTFAKPVVATTVGGLPEQVEHERTGYLVPPEDEQALADAVVRLLKDPDLRHKMGEHGKQKLQREWAPEIVARHTLTVYDRAIQGRQLKVAKSGVQDA